jgi:hypothetical protein
VRHGRAQNPLPAARKQDASKHDKRETRTHAFVHVFTEYDPYIAAVATASKLSKSEALLAEVVIIPPTTGRVRPHLQRGWRRQARAGPPAKAVSWLCRSEDSARWRGRCLNRDIAGPQRAKDGRMKARVLPAECSHQQRRAKRDQNALVSAHYSLMITASADLSRLGHKRSMCLGALPSRAINRSS